MSYINEIQKELFIFLMFEYYPENEVKEMILLHFDIEEDYLMELLNNLKIENDRYKLTTESIKALKKIFL